MSNNSISSTKIGMTQHTRTIPRVCLVAPLPPPYGGIARWAELITYHARLTGSAVIHVVDTAPRWRAIHDLCIWRRVLCGTLHGLGMIFQLFGYLIRGTDVVHLATSGQLAIHRDIIMMRLARVFRVPVLYHLHFGRVPELAASNNSEWRSLVKALRLATVTIPIDNATETTLKMLLPLPTLSLLPNCVDLNSLPILKPSSMVPHIVLYLGWVIPTKGIEELLLAWGRLSNPSWQLLIAGPCEDAFRLELSSRYSTERVQFLGPLSHMDSLALMTRASIFVLPSHTEGFPNVIAEAMALARPIVATSVGAIPEMLQGGCGIIIPAKDPVSLQHALEQLINNEPLRNSLGRASQKKLQACYTLDSVFPRLLRLWQETTS